MCLVTKAFVYSFILVILFYFVHRSEYICVCVKANVCKYTEE